MVYTYLQDNYQNIHYVSIIMLWPYLEAFDVRILAPSLNVSSVTLRNVVR